MFSGRPSHPIRTGWYQAVLAKRSIPTLLLFYFVITALSSALFGLLYLVTDTSNNLPYWEWWFIAGVQHLGIEPPASLEFELSPIQYGVFLVSGAMGLVLPALLLGSIVFKIFVNPRQIAFSERAWVYYHERYNRYVIEMRFYNTTAITMHDVSLRFYLIRTMEWGNSDKLLKEHHHNRASPNKPHRTYLELRAEDVEEIGNRLVIKSIHGHPVEDQYSIGLVVRGEQMQLGTLVSAYHRFSNIMTASNCQKCEIIIGKPPDYSNENTSEINWENFDPDFDELSEPITLAEYRLISSQGPLHRLKLWLRQLFRGRSVD